MLAPCWIRLYGHWDPPNELSSKRRIWPHGRGDVTSTPRECQLSTLRDSERDSEGKYYIYLHIYIYTDIYIIHYDILICVQQCKKKNHCDTRLLLFFFLLLLLFIPYRPRIFTSNTELLGLTNCKVVSVESSQVQPRLHNFLHSPPGTTWMVQFKTPPNPTDLIWFTVLCIMILELWLIFNTKPGRRVDFPGRSTSYIYQLSMFIPFLG